MFGLQSTLSQSEFKMRELVICILNFSIGLSDAIICKELIGNIVNTEDRNRFKSFLN